MSAEKIQRVRQLVDKGAMLTSEEGRLLLEYVDDLRADLAAANEKHMTAEARLDSVGIMLAGADKQIETLAAAAALHERNAIKAERDLAAAKADAERLRTFIDNNMTFYNVDADWPVEGPNIPVLAQVSNRIWYHATDDTTSYPFSAVIDAATGRTQPIAPAIDAAITGSEG